MADITDLIDYYANLLIIQYNDLPNASATISLLAETVLANGVAFDVQNAYNIDPDLGDTAVGVQLDVMGKYAGVSRYFSAINYGAYFTAVNYNQYNALPHSPPAWGFTTYATYSSDPSYNGTLYYGELVTSQNKLSDSDFLTLIQLAIARNNMNFSDEEIDTAIWEIFAPSIWAEEGSVNMTMFYFCLGDESSLLRTIIQQKVFPKPMGVGLGIVIGITGPMFSLISYTNQNSPFGHGLCTYATYASLAGEDLTYSMIQEQ
jgi:Protein of unknown function (DUF2612)